MVCINTCSVKYYIDNDDEKRFAGKYKYYSFLLIFVNFPKHFIFHYVSDTLHEAWILKYTNYESSCSDITIFCDIIKRTNVICIYLREVVIETAFMNYLCCVSDLY